MDGFINVLKPPGMTSHDVVSFIRRTLKQKKVGHTGTLDPGAVGVLPICVGKATRLADFVTEMPKSYRAEITFGITTDSQDAYGKVTHMQDCSGLDYEVFLQVISNYMGTITQIPPMVSALKVGGKRLYSLAREGIEVERKPRKIDIYSINPLKAEWEMPNPRVLFDVTCSKGTYVRTLCHDIGQEMGVGANMSFLIRRSSGPFHIDQSFTIEEIAHYVSEQNMTFIQSMQSGISSMPVFVLDAKQANAIMHGNSIKISGYQPNDKQLYRLENKEELLLAIGYIKLDNNDIVLKPVKVFS